MVPDYSSIFWFLFRSVHSLRLSATPWTEASKASLFITNSLSPLKLMSIESVMPSNHLILCCPLLLLPSIFPSIRVFSTESILRVRWPKYWSFSFSISFSNEYSGLISFRIDWFDLLAVPDKPKRDGHPTKHPRIIRMGIRESLTSARYPRAVSTT